jgi:limonene 1,2-monooxygenase
MISPSGPRLAGSLGTSLLSLSMSVPGGYAAVENTWEIVREQAAKAGRDEPDRADWRVLSIMHIADTKDQAIDDCIYGLQDFANYFGAAGFVPLSNSVGAPSHPASSSLSMRRKEIAVSAHPTTQSHTSKIYRNGRAVSEHC